MKPFGDEEKKLTEKEKKIAKTVGAALVFLLIKEYWKDSNPKQKFNIVFHWLSLFIILTLRDEGTIGSISNILVWVVIIRSLYVLSKRWGEELKKGETYFGNFINHWNKILPAERFWLAFGIFFLLLFIGAIIYSGFE